MMFALGGSLVLHALAALGLLLLGSRGGTTGVPDGREVGDEVLVELALAEGPRGHAAAPLPAPESPRRDTSAPATSAPATSAPATSAPATPEAAPQPAEQHAEQYAEQHHERSAAEAAEVASTTRRGRDQEHSREPVAGQAVGNVPPGSETHDVVAEDPRDEPPDDPERPQSPDRQNMVLGSLGLPGVDSSGARQALVESLTCRDPVAGTWEARRYSPRYHDWALFTLHIRHATENRLRGTITARMWSGSASDTVPPVCGPLTHDYTVRMDAAGHFDGRQFYFAAASGHRVIRATCPAPGFAYNEDRFRGSLAAPEVLDTVNNDGGREINAPYRFRRVSCDTR